MSGTRPDPTSMGLKSAAETGPLSASTLPPSDQPAPAADKRADRIELTVRTLNHAELELAVKLYAETPGWGNYAEAFRSDALKLIDSPPSAVIGVFMRDGVLVGTGCAVKEMFDFAYWSITWVMVDGALRGQGIGARVVGGIEEYVLRAQDEYNNPNCRMLLSAVDENAEKFYQRLGYKTLLRGPLVNDGEAFMYKDLRGPGLDLKVELRT